MSQDIRAVALRQPEQSPGVQPATHQVEGECFELHRSRCRRAVCPKCCKAKRNHEGALAEIVLEGWKHPFLLTLTVDGSEFAGRERELFEHFQGKCPVAELMRSLARRGYCVKGQYFYATEFQKNGQIHFHVVCETTRNFIPHDVLEKRWNDFAPSWASPVESRARDKYGRLRNPLGNVQFEQLRSKAGTARYVAGYVAKGVDAPQWYRDLIDQGRKLQLFRFCNHLRKDAEEKLREREQRVKAMRQDGKKRASHRRLTLDEAIRLCGLAGVVVRRRELVFMGGRRVDWKYIGRVGDFSQACEELGVDPRVRRCVVKREELAGLVGTRATYDDDEERLEDELRARFEQWAGSGGMRRAQA